MTTVCFRGGVVAADTMIAYTTYTNGNRDKVAKVGKYLVALAGPAWLRYPLEEWVEGGCTQDFVPPELIENEDHFAALIIDENGVAHEFTNGYLVPIYADYTAIGSGAIFAIGAMAHGATAEEAVVAASKHDKNTGGPVTSISIETLN